MNYMLDKLKLHPKGEEIIKVAFEIAEKIENDDRFLNNEKLLLMDMIVAKINYYLYKISGDSK